jgi:hypothetical protein
MRAFLLHVLQNYKAWKTFLIAKANQLIRQRNAKRARKDG